MSSWSAYSNYQKAKPNAVDPLVDFRQRLLQAAGQDPAAADDRPIPLTWTLTLLLAKKRGKEHL